MSIIHYFSDNYHWYGRIDTISQLTQGSILFLALMKYMPQRLTEYLLKSSQKMKRACEHQKLMQGFAKHLMDQKYEAALQGKGSQDVLTSGNSHLALAVFGCFSCPRAS